MHLRMPAKFRFGVAMWSAANAVEWGNKALEAEELGYDVLLTPDHIAPGALAPLLALSAAASATKNIRLGTLVLNNDFRRPVLLARDAAALDVLCDGRFELGIGAGHMESEYLECGIPFDPAETRIARLAESVEILQRLFAGERLTFNGAHYQVRDHALTLRPPQLRIPLLVGGNDRRILELAARTANTVGFTGFFPSEGGRRPALKHFAWQHFEQRLAIVRAAAGDRFGSLELQALIQVAQLTDDPRAAAEPWRARAPNLSLDDILESPFVLLGNADAMAEKLKQLRSRFGLSYFVVFESALTDFAKVIAKLR